MPLKKVDWDNYAFRCHYFGELMTRKKGKSNLEKYNEAAANHSALFEKVSTMNDGAARDNALKKLIALDEELKKLKELKDIPPLSDTCKKRLVQIYTEETTGRKKDIESMYLEKGLKTEEESITLYSLKTGNMYRKNKERISNGYVIGEIDFDDEEEDVVIDTKSSFDIFTFDATIAKPINPIYHWQGQMYMWLKDRSRFRLAYCLNNTPTEIINRLKKQLMYKSIFVSEEDYEEACKLIEEKHLYDDLPIERKIRVYEVERNEEMIELAKTYIPYFRAYLKSIDNNKSDIYDSED